MFKVISLICLMLLSACAEQAPVEPPVAWLPHGTNTEPPTQYRNLCRVSARMCRLTIDDNTRPMIDALLVDHKQHFSVIASKPKDPDVWAAVMWGDCDRFAFSLLAGLQDLFPAKSAAFGVAIAITETGDRHMVTTIDTNEGTYICDVRYSSCMPWGAFPYHWVSRMIDGRWYSLGKDPQASKP